MTFAPGSDPAGELPHDTAEGGYQGTTLDAWEVLEEVGLEADWDLLTDIATALPDHAWCKRDYFLLSAFDRRRLGWDGFKQAVMHDRRFTFWSLNDDGTPEDHPDHLPVGKMLAEVGDLARDAGLIRVLRVGTGFWRVRVHDCGTVLDKDHQLSPPPTERATQPNRMSPAGIPMFYGASDFETACSETVGSSGSPGRMDTGAIFRTVRELRVLDLTRLSPVPSFFDTAAADGRDGLRFLHHFVRDLARPLERDRREHIEYVPTQAFTEYVRYMMKSPRGRPIDGIRFRSSKNGGRCIVLFCGQSQCVEDSDRPWEQRWLKFDPASLRTAATDDLATAGMLKPTKP